MGGGLPPPFSFASNKVVRVLLVHNILNDSRSVSGVLKHYLLMAKGWHSLGVKTDFYMAKAGFKQVGDQVPDAGLISSDSLFDATNYITQTWRYFPAYGLRTASALWTKLDHTYDLVYATNQPIFEVFPARHLARRQKAKLAVKYHHVLSAQPKRGAGFDKLFLKSEEITTRWLNKEADLIICSTPGVDRDFHQLEARLGLQPRETKVIGYGLEMDELLREVPAEKRYDAVYLGRLHEHKGALDLPEVWAEAVRQQPQAKLLVIGEGPRRPVVQQKCAELGIANSITFTGGIPEQQKNDLLRQCRIGLSLSYEEGWGLSVTECMAFGMPVVAYHLPIFDHVFGTNLEYVPRGDKPAFAKTLAALIANPDRQSIMGNRNREFVRKYDYREVARQELAAMEALFK